MAGMLKDHVMSHLDPLYMANLFLRQRRHDEAITVATQILEKNPYDQAAWLIKTRGLTEEVRTNDLNMEEAGIAEVLMDDDGIGSVPRPGTSFRKANVESRAGQRIVTGQGVRPQTNGRPVSGFERPKTKGEARGGGRQAIFTSSKPGTARPVSSRSGRHVRTGTASLVADEDGPFIDVSKLRLDKYAEKTTLSKGLFEYILYKECNPRIALDLALESCKRAGYKDWWWKKSLGKCYYALGLYRDALSVFNSALKSQPMIETFILLSKVYIRIDQPKGAIRCLTSADKAFTSPNPLILKHLARIYELLEDVDKSTEFYKKALDIEGADVEALACLAANLFYTDQPGAALHLYRVLLYQGHKSVELLNNLGLCAFYANQYDDALAFLQQATELSDDTNAADVWYNKGQVAVALGDLGLGYRCFKLATACEQGHAEAYNNLGVLEKRKGNLVQARANFKNAAEVAPWMYEPYFNGAQLHYHMGNLEAGVEMLRKSLSCFATHAPSTRLESQFQEELC